MKNNIKSLALALCATSILSIFTACTYDSENNSENKTEGSNITSIYETTSCSDVESEIEVEVDENAGGEENGMGYDIEIN